MTNNTVLNTQIFMSTIIITFSMFMIYKGGDPGIYLPVITAISGSWLPSPLQTKQPIRDIEQPLV